MEIFADLQMIGDRALDLYNLDLDDYDRGAVLQGLRTLSQERAKIERERADTERLKAGR